MRHSLQIPLQSCILPAIEFQESTGMIHPNSDSFQLDFFSYWLFISDIHNSIGTFRAYAWHSQQFLMACSVRIYWPVKNICGDCPFWIFIPQKAVIIESVVHFLSIELVNSMQPVNLI